MKSRASVHYWLLVAFLCLPLFSFAQYTGGSADGFSNGTFCGSNLTGGSLSVISLSTISGEATFCFNSGQNYSVNVLSGIATSFVWSSPSGGTVFASQNGAASSVASFGFGIANATVQVTATNGCSSATALLAVTGTNCNITLGGSADGFSNGTFCGTNLAGGALAPITLSAITGASPYCFNLGQNYSATVESGLATSFVWKVTSGGGTASSSVSTTISSIASIRFPGASGSIQLDATNGCFSDSKSIAVTGQSCDNALGGNDDGFSNVTFCGSNLTGGAITPLTLGAISGNTTPCFDLGDNYSVITTTGNANSFVWTVPTGASQTSAINTFTSSLSTITFGGSSGTISVIASNSCYSDTKSLLVSGVNCLVARGGVNDGFAMAQVIDVPLPVTLISFTAKALENAIELKWVTETEINNDYFEIEQSKDGRVFSPVGKVTGAGNSKTVQNYSFVDKQPYQGISYYRLKQVDFDKHFEYSSTLSVEYNGTTDNFNVLIYPNPTVGSTFNVRFNTSWEGSDVTMDIKDITGKTIFKKTFNVTGSLFIKPIDESLKPGVYLVIFYHAEKKVINRLVIQ
jgi:hypothetical protein